MDKKDDVVHVDSLVKHPENFSSKRLRVIGILLWHDDEPRLFADQQAIDNSNFKRSLHLEIPPDFSLDNQDIREVYVAGIFIYSKTRASDANYANYEGFLRVESIQDE